MAVIVEKQGSDCSEGRTVQYANFYYPVDEKNGEKYVDFTGEWQGRDFCTDGTVAVSKYEFNDAGLTFSGQECKNGTAKDLAESEQYTYEKLANIDYWWFNQTGRESEATLGELNTVVRFCDIDGYEAGSVCTNPEPGQEQEDNEYFVKWEYQPAGVKWDQGVLSRVKMKRDGTVANRSLLQKVIK